MIPEWATRARSGWRYDGRERPPFAIPPGAGQESVWDYPRPPRLEVETREVIVRAGAALVGRSTRAMRLLETASPPTVYMPPGDIDMSLLAAAAGRSRCEWKGEARFWTVRAPGARLERAAWSYPEPFPEYERLRDCLAFYPARLECFVSGVRVVPQPGGFYAGWITPDIVGPVKGEPGTEWW